jgi:hypothetical protein
MGIENRMRIGLKSLLVVVAAAALPLAPPVERANAAVQQQASAAKAKRHVHRHSSKRHSTTRRWRGYGFLPGYRPQIPDSVPLGRSAMTGGYEMRYWHYGQYLYGWGRPRFFRGRWNGGGFGPCWATTPIGLMWTCGR